MPLILAACATQPQQSQEQPSNESSATEVVEPVVNTSKVSETASAPQAVLSLIERSQQLLNNEDVKGASSSLERAIRIAPRYPNSYYHLAEVRHIEGQNVQARSLAKKALSLGAQDDLLEAILLLLDKAN
ncbi:MAG: hypothetical protein GY951_10210 [Psychromonas sp.]|nr:hypothetical protein [Psychromonas sp.]